MPWIFVDIWTHTGIWKASEGKSFPIQHVSYAGTAG